MITGLLVSHILIATGGLVSTTWSALRPSKRKLHVSYSLVALTFLSGTVLVILSHQPILKSCLSGLVYLAVALTGTVTALNRLKADN